MPILGKSEFLRSAEILQAGMQDAQLEKPKEENIARSQWSSEVPQVWTAWVRPCSTVRRQAQG